MVSHRTARGLLKFRLFELADLDLYLSWVNQEAIWEVDNSGPYEIRTRDTFGTQWQKIVAWGRSWFIEVDGSAIGYIGLISDAEDAVTHEFFIVIGDTREWGKGYGKSAMAWLSQEARRQGLDRLTGQVLGNNRRALRFYEALGFVVVDRCGPTFDRNGEVHQMLLIEKKF